MSKADVADAFQNVPVEPDKARIVCHAAGDLAVTEFRLTLGWSGSPGFWGVMSAAAAHAHCKTTIDSAQLLDEGQHVMAQVKLVKRWEAGKPTSISPDAKIRTHGGGRTSYQFFTAVYVKDYLQIRVQHSDDVTTALIASASLGSDHVRLFGPGEVGVTPILAPKKAWTGTPR